MKSIKTLALVTGLMAISGVSQAQFSSTWTLVSDYDFRGFSQSAKDPALQGSADYAFGDSGFAIGAWASNVDFGTGVDADIELDIYASYTGEINDTFSWTAGANFYTYPGSDDAGDYVEIFAGFSAGSFGFKQWFTDDMFCIGVNAQYTVANYSAALGEKFSLGFHAGYAWGDFWEDAELFDYSVALNYAAGNFTIFGKFTGTDASGPLKIESDANNNEPRFLVGVTTTFPWGD
jgi:uncharacterized protein (TIGR02001 family)